MISLAPDRPSERAEHIGSVPQAVEDVPEIEARRPAEFIPSAKIDVDAIDTWEHSPTALAIRILVVGEETLNHRWCIRAEA